MTNAPFANVDDLFARALIGLDEDNDWTSNNPTGREAVACLHGLAGREVLGAALGACEDANPLRRRVGAEVLGQLGHLTGGLDAAFGEERYRGLANLLAAEQTGRHDADVLQAGCIALGHLQDPRAIPALLELRQHPNSGVRFGVAFGLCGHRLFEAIGGLIALSTDCDADVRDWATFGLGQMIDTDTPAIRTALHARLADPCLAVCSEAIEGLATRGDLSVIPVLMTELHTRVALPLLNAAIALARPELCPALAATAAAGLVVETGCEPYDLTSVWTEAMQACGCLGGGATVIGGEGQ